jgi:uncharacterized protein (TIGR03083 family)
MRRLYGAHTATQIPCCHAAISRLPTVPEPSPWEAALETVAGLGDTATDEQWRLQTPCPGWSVGDVVAHLIDIEQLMAGSPRPEHEPDWSALPHAQGDFGRMTEVGVDARRGQRREDVLAELRETIALDGPSWIVPEAEVIGPFGNPTTMDRLLRIRSSTPGPTSRTSARRWGSTVAGTRPQPPWRRSTRALLYVWARTVGAPEAPPCMEITDPSLPRDMAVEATADGRVSMPRRVRRDRVADRILADLMRLACGRVDVGDPELRTRLVLRGDAGLGKPLLLALSITP